MKKIVPQLKAGFLALFLILFGNVPSAALTDGSREAISERALSEVLKEIGEFGYNIAENPVNAHDFQATILHLMRIDHEQLIF